MPLLLLWLARFLIAHRIEDMGATGPTHRRQGYRCAGGMHAPRYPEPMVDWDQVTRDDVVRAIREYDRLGPEEFFSDHGFAPTTTYELVWEGRSYPPKAILGTAYELAVGKRLASGDFEGGKTGAVKVLEKLGFTIEHK